ncbi:LysR family transcriptional regulator (plasmid) [Burkholderia thailandensis]|uniref:LysR family transcriptional regulator n=1 Tax=Burkholderia thailandensis TaxID=57975 RepID=UPI00192DB947|nr:LysR family transcriptional regulator [Burkholderia thailandensis]MBS2132267.1 LysR family transcriptional regulator [Burkholderia thailandensis]QRA15357.1 LysR family transcriptional regulator [Burkholderia thailandensis]
MDRIQSMRVFIKVAELSSFCKAATALDMGNAVVTRHIAELERSLGARLMNRTTRSLSLTESGQVYLERATQILDDLDELEHLLVARNHEPVGTLRIVAPVVFGLNNLAPALHSYAQRYPRVVPNVTLVDREVNMVEEGFDIGIVIAEHVRSASVVMRRLTSGCIAVCATPDYLERHGVPQRPEQLLEHHCLSLPADQGGDACVFTGPGGEAVRVRPTHVAFANNAEMLRQLALLGYGIAILPSYLIERDIASGRLVGLLPEYQLPCVDVHIAYPSRHYLPAKVRTFIDHLIEQFALQPAGAYPAPRVAATQAQAIPPRESAGHRVRPESSTPSWPRLTSWRGGGEVSHAFAQTLAGRRGADAHLRPTDRDEKTDAHRTAEADREADTPA